MGFNVLRIRHGWYEQKRYIYNITVLALQTAEDLHSIGEIYQDIQAECEQVVDCIVRIPDEHGIPDGSILSTARQIIMQRSHTSNVGVFAVICTNFYLRSLGHTLQETYPPVCHIFQIADSEEEALAFINRAKRQRAKRATGRFGKAG